MYVESREGTFVKWMNRALCLTTSAQAQAEAEAEAAENARAAASSSEEGAAQRARAGPGPRARPVAGAGQWDPANGNVDTAGAEEDEIRISSKHWGLNSFDDMETSKPGPGPGAGLGPGPVTEGWHGSGFHGYTMGNQVAPGPVTESFQIGRSPSDTSADLAVTAGRSVGPSAGGIVGSKSTIIRKEARRKAADTWTSMCVLYCTVQFGASPDPQEPASLTT